MYKAHFETEKGWHAAIAAAVIAGLTFDAYERGEHNGAGHFWTIEYTGGY